MGSLRNIQVVFDDTNRVYSQNDVVRGKVIVEVNGPKDLKKVKGVSVLLKGKAKVRYKYRESDHGNNRAQVRREAYINSLQVLCGTGPYEQNTSMVRLPPGTSTFPFELRLASQDNPLPQSLEVHNGHIRYKVKATLVVSGLILDDKYHDKKRLTFAGPILDLNGVRNVEVPLNSQAKRYNCCGCGSTVDVEIFTSLPRQGYVPGENIFILGHVDNRDGAEQIHFTASLRQYTHLKYTKHSTHTRKETLSAAATFVGCPRGQVTDFRLGPLLVPQVPSSGVRGCSIIDIHYFVKVKNYASKENIPVIIGTIPLETAMLPTAPTALPTAPTPLPTAPPAQFTMDTTGIQISVQDDRDGLPTYDEALHMAEGPTAC